MQKLCIKVGDYIKRGQLLTKKNINFFPIHSSVSGFIKKISDNYLPIKNKKFKKFIFIESDAKDNWYKEKKNYYNNFSSYSAIYKMHHAGIKIFDISLLSNKNTLQNKIKNINTLVITIVSNKYYYTVNDYLIKNNVHEIFKGLNILSKILKIKKIVFFLKKVEKNLIFLMKKIIYEKKINNIKIFSNKFSFFYFYKKIKYFFILKLLKKSLVIKNIQNLYFIKRFCINHESLTEKFITLIINSTKNIYTIKIRIGTLIRDILLKIKTFKEKNYVIAIGENIKKLSFSLIDVPITDDINIILILLNKKEYLKKDNTCIHCNACEKYCPINLKPQIIYWNIQNKNSYNKNIELHKCIECNVCSYVCPSNIPLKKIFHHEKKKIYINNFNIKKYKQSYKRFLLKKIYLKKEKQNNKNLNFNISNNYLGEQYYKKLVNDAIIRSKKKFQKLLYNNLKK